MMSLHYHRRVLADFLTPRDFACLQRAAFVLFWARNPHL